MQIPVRQPHGSRLRRALAALAVLVVCAVPLAACDSDPPPPTPANSEQLKSKGCC